MSALLTCPRCGAPLAPTSRAGALCSRCLLAEGLARSIPAGTPASRAPSIEELAADLPELEVLELVGEGGMGAVYRARQRSLDRIVALKVLAPELARDPAFASRFEREARALARLSHPNVVLVHDFGRTGERFWFVMEFVEGASLRHLMRAERVAPREALAIVAQVCDALQYAHDQGVVHRDIKPENVLVDRKGRVKVADFGLAKLAARGEAEAALTRTEQTMGTPQYMAPEQLEHSRDVDHRADIYSLGVVFYELLTGELPLGRFDPPSSKVELDVRLDEVVLRSLAKEPERRYQHASEVRTDIDSISSSKPASLRTDPAAHPALAPTAPAKPVYRKSAFVHVLAMSFLAGLSLRWMFGFGLAGAAFTGSLLAVGVFTGLSMALAPDQRVAWRASGLASRAVRSVLAALLFLGGCASLWIGAVEGWTRETPDYVSSRPNHRSITAVQGTNVGSALLNVAEGQTSADRVLREAAAHSHSSDFEVRWSATDRDGGFALEHRPARLGALLVGALLLLVCCVPIVASGHGASWGLGLGVPALALIGLAATLPIAWLRALDEGDVEKARFVHQWQVDEGIDAIRARLERYLAESGYRAHTRVLGTVLYREAPIAHYDVLGADIDSPFERFVASHGELRRAKPHLLIQLAGDLEQTSTAVHLDAGEARVDRAAEWQWKFLLEELERTSRGPP